MGRSKLFAF